MTEVRVRAARADDVTAICGICTRAFHATYTGLVPQDYLERMLKEFYTPERLRSEIAPTPPGRLGHQVIEVDGRVLGRVTPEKLREVLP